MHEVELKADLSSTWRWA